MKKIKKISGVLCILVTMFYLVSVSAAGVIERISSTYKIPAEYSMTFDRFDQYKPFGTDDLDKEDSLYPAGGNPYGSKNWANSTRIIDNSKKGTFGGLFTNVATYQGQKIDLKMTIVDYTLWPEYVRSPYRSIGVAYAPSPGVLLVGIRDVRVRFEFLISGTNTPISVKGYGTTIDLDGLQYFEFHDGVEKAFILDSNTHLNAEGSNRIISSPTLTTNEDPLGWATILFSGSSFELSFGVPLSQPVYGDYFGFTSFGIVGVDTPGPIKDVSKDNVNINEDFTYTVYHYVPASLPEHYYKSYVFTDTLDSCLSVTDASGLVIKNNRDKDVTNKFDVSINGQTITATLKNINDADFYGYEYAYNITTKIKSSCDLSKYEKDGKVSIPNIGHITIDGNTMDTNEVVITHIPEIVEVPETASFIPLIISTIAVLLIIVGITGYYFARKKKLV